MTIVQRLPIVVEGNDGTGKSTLVAALRARGYSVQDRGLATKMSDDDELPDDGRAFYVILDAPVAVSRERLAAAGKDLLEQYHTVEDLTHYREKFRQVAARLVHRVVLDSSGSREQTLAAALTALAAAGWNDVTLRSDLVADVIVGGLYGDEGKGKLVGRIGQDYDAVLRVNASTNAGHCVQDGATLLVTRQLPSVLWPRTTLLVIAPGALLNPLALAEEVAGRPDLAALRDKVRVASSVALVLRPYIEKGQGGVSGRLGSTHQGTGPAAAARAAKHALRLFDLQAAVHDDDCAWQDVRDKLEHTICETLPHRFEVASAALTAHADELLEELCAAYRLVESYLGAFCVDYTRLLRDELCVAGRRVLIEGCNGLLLDNLHGALPHVTSASTNIGALLAGANLPPAVVGRATVVIAAYANCLGPRPFPTELSTAEAAHFHAHCNEVDVAQHQTRRVGWLDLPALRKALVGSRGAVLHLNKLDVLSGLETLRVCTHYEIDGEVSPLMPDDPTRCRRAIARYRELPGWTEPLSAARSFEALPAAARDYVRLLEAELGLPIASLGVGPDNDDFIALESNPRGPF